MRGFTSTTVIGTVGKDPEMKYTPTGMAITNFSVAVNRKSKGEETTEWFECVAFDRSAETLNEYLRQGSNVHVVGRMQSRKYKPSWADKEIKVWELVVDNFTLLGDAKRGEDDGARPARGRDDDRVRAGGRDEFDDSRYDMRGRR